MPLTSLIALLAWLPISVLLFAVLGVRRGLCVSAVAGYLFLPSVAFQIADGLPPVSKDFVISASCLIAALIFDPAPISRFRPSWFDVFPVVGLVGWGISSLVNGLGIQDALLQWWYYLMFAGIPYFVARCYLTGVGALRDLAVVLVGSTVIYAALAILEMRLSPQLNRWIYGFQTFAFWETRRDLQIGSFSLGGFRPRVFLPTGLALAIWMAASTSVAWGLWFGGFRGSILKLKIPVVAVGLAITTVLCRGTGAFTLMGAAIATFLATKWLRWKWAILWLPFFAAIYIGTALVGQYLPLREALVEASDAAFGAVRAGSLDFRFRHEAALVDRAMQSPMFGWGGWNRNRVDSDIAREVLGEESITDGFWIIALGQRGLVGLVATYGWMLLPATLAVLWAVRVKAPPPVLYMVIGLSGWSSLFAIDQLLNGFNHPVQALVAGALGSFVLLARQHVRIPWGTATTTSTTPRGRRDPGSPRRSPVAAPPLPVSVRSGRG